MHRSAGPSLTALRQQAHTGRLIRPHRAMRRYRFARRLWLDIIGLPLAATALFGLCRDAITAWWAAVLVFWLERTGVETSMLQVDRTLAGWRLYTLHVPEPQAHLPSLMLWSTTATATTAAMLISYLTLRRHLPIVYLVWAGALVQGASLMFFYAWPTAFPHTAGSHLRAGLDMAAAFLLFTPWLLAVSYYVFDFGLVRKVLCTLLVIGTILVFTPMQYAVHAWILARCSLLFAPLLFVFGTLLIDVLLFVSVYGWAMSWKNAQ